MNRTSTSSSAEKNLSDTNAAPIINISAADLPIYCPNREQNLSNLHPRVFLQMIDQEAVCPYCGTHYHL